MQQTGGRACLVALQWYLALKQQNYSRRWIMMALKSLTQKSRNRFAAEVSSGKKS